MRKTTTCAAGFDTALGGGGDPSPWTALGTFLGIQAACEYRYGSKDLKGRTIAVQGVGHVGMYLLAHLAKAGAKVVTLGKRILRTETASITIMSNIVYEFEL